MTKNKYGISYRLPKVFLLKESGIGVAELAARTCYDSFENSENESIKLFKEIIDKEPNELIYSQVINKVNDIQDSSLLDSLAWAYQHHSILEHATLSYLIKGTSRGVLQEHARHRIQSISVRSTRYTMSGIINAYLAYIYGMGDIKEFYQLLESLDFLVLADKEMRKIEYDSILNKLNMQRGLLGDEEFKELSLAKSSYDLVKEGNIFEIFEKLQKGKKKRNVGDPFKHIVSDNWKVDMVVTFNIRSLKNYFNLRDSGAAWFQIQWLAEEIKKVTPIKYLKLIDKKFKE